VKKLLILVCVALLGISTAAAVRADFLLGMVAGGLLFGGDTNKYGGGAGSLLYLADEKVLRATNPMRVRMVSTGHTCFSPGSSSNGTSIFDLFNYATKKAPVKNPTILRVTRVFSPESLGCGAIWFEYVEK